MATVPTMREEPDAEADGWELVQPVWDEARIAKNKAIREELLKAASVTTVHRKYTRDELLDLFKRLRDGFQSRFPGRNPLEEFLAERRAEAERE